MRLFRVLHHWLVPHESNNHRARALHHQALLGYVLLFAIFNLAVRFVHIQAPDILGYATDIRVDQLLATTNAKRAEAGLSPLSLNPVLSQAAAAKASDMFSNNYWAHNSPSGKTPWDFIVGAGYSYVLAGENLAKNFQTSQGVVDAWMASPTHRDNIVKAGYQEVGYAVVNGVLSGEETTLVVQMFGTTNARPVAQIPKVEAASPIPTAIPTTMPIDEPVALQQAVQQLEEQPVIIPTEPAAVIEEPAVNLPPSFENGFTLQAVTTNPLVNIPSLTKTITYVMAGLLIGLFAVDAYIVGKKRLVRLVGHNLTHIFFLLTIVMGGLAITRGSLI